MRILPELLEVGQGGIIGLAGCTGLAGLLGEC